MKKYEYINLRDTDGDIEIITRKELKEMFPTLKLPQFRNLERIVFKGEEIEFFFKTKKMVYKKYHGNWALEYIT